MMNFNPTQSGVNAANVGMANIQGDPFAEINNANAAGLPGAGGGMGMG